MVKLRPEFSTSKSELFVILFNYCFNPVGFPNTYFAMLHPSAYIFPLRSSHSCHIFTRLMCMSTEHMPPSFPSLWKASNLCISRIYSLRSFGTWIIPLPLLTWQALRSNAAQTSPCNPQALRIKVPLSAVPLPTTHPSALPLSTVGQRHKASPLLTGSQREALHYR